MDFVIDLIAIAYCAFIWLLASICAVAREARYPRNHEAGGGIGKAGDYLP